MRIRRILAALSVAVALVATGCGADDDQDRASERPRIEDPGPVHVHGLGINPRDGALFIATHTGVFRAGPRERTARRVGDRLQDTMGFTVVGADRFLGSGHPDGRDRLPPFLGLIESRDAARTWKPISLLGKRDFHVLEAEGQRVYGFGSDFETRKEGLLVSDDGGRGWEERPTPGPLIALAVHPTDPGRVVASGEESLYASSDAGRTWRPLGGDPGLLAWPTSERLYAAGADGAVSLSRDDGRSWRLVGEVGGEPAAFLGQGARELYVALHDGTIKRSSDGGATWSIRSRP
jgi:hypothetical protein